MKSSCTLAAFLPSTVLSPTLSPRPRPRQTHRPLVLTLTPGHRPASSPSPSPSPLPAPDPPLPSFPLASRALRAAYVVLFFSGLTAAAVGCRLATLAPGTLSAKRARAAVVSTAVFRLALQDAAPWLEVRGAEAVRLRFLEAAAEDGELYVICNHNSPFDSLLVAGLVPLSVASVGLRSFIKALLLDEPLFGGICRDVGHFPVHFKRPGFFEVWKDKQAVVSEQVEEYVAGGGGLCLFPEGTLNRGDPRVLQDFRRGGFRLAIKYRRAIWAVVNAGADEVWPIGVKVGGYPGTVDVRMVKVCDDAGEFEGVEEIAKEARRVMQEVLDDMYALRDAEKGR